MYKIAVLLVLSVTVMLAGSPSSPWDSQESWAVAPDSFRQLEQLSQARSHQQALEVAAKEQQFVESFNRLASALEEFSRTYKTTHAIDVKKMKSIREAYRKLQQADPWFRVNQ
jgi:hypothetical protein